MAPLVGKNAVVGGEALARPVWPYWDGQADPDELHQALVATDALLEPNGAGGWRWRVLEGARDEGLKTGIDAQ